MTDPRLQADLEELFGGLPWRGPMSDGPTWKTPWQRSMRETLPWSQVPMLRSGHTESRALRPRSTGGDMLRAGPVQSFEGMLLLLADVALEDDPEVFEAFAAEFPSHRQGRSGVPTKRSTTLKPGSSRPRSESSDPGRGPVDVVEEEEELDLRGSDPPTDRPRTTDLDLDPPTVRRTAPPEEEEEESPLEARPPRRRPPGREVPKGPAADRIRALIQATAKQGQPAVVALAKQLAGEAKAAQRAQEERSSSGGDRRPPPRPPIPVGLGRSGGPRSTSVPGTTLESLRSRGHDLARGRLGPELLPESLDDRPSTPRTLALGSTQDLLAQPVDGVEPDPLGTTPPVERPRRDSSVPSREVGSRTAPHGSGPGTPTPHRTPVPRRESGRVGTRRVGSSSAPGTLTPRPGRDPRTEGTTRRTSGSDGTTGRRPDPGSDRTPPRDETSRREGVPQRDDSPRSGDSLQPSSAGTLDSKASRSPSAPGRRVAPPKVESVRSVSAVGQGSPRVPERPIVKPPPPPRRATPEQLAQADEFLRVGRDHKAKRKHRRLRSLHEQAKGGLFGASMLRPLFQNWSDQQGPISGTEGRIDAPTTLPTGDGIVLPSTSEPQVSAPLTEGEQPPQESSSSDRTTPTTGRPKRGRRGGQRADELFGRGPRVQGDGPKPPVVGSPTQDKSPVPSTRSPRSGGRKATRSKTPQTASRLGAGLRGLRNLGLLLATPGGLNDRIHHGGPLDRSGGEAADRGDFLGALRSHEHRRARGAFGRRKAKSAPSSPGGMTIPSQQLVLHSLEQSPPPDPLASTVPETQVLPDPTEPGTDPPVIPGPGLPGSGSIVPGQPVQGTARSTAPTGVVLSGPTEPGSSPPGQPGFAPPGTVLGGQRPRTPGSGPPRRTPPGLEDEVTKIRRRRRMQGQDPNAPIRFELGSDGLSEIRGPMRPQSGLGGKGPPPPPPPGTTRELMGEPDQPIQPGTGKAGTSGKGLPPPPPPKTIEARSEPEGWDIQHTAPGFEDDQEGLADLAEFELVDLLRALARRSPEARQSLLEIRRELDRIEQFRQRRRY